MTAPGHFKAECPYCGQPVEVPEELANDWVTCPDEACGKSFPPIAKQKHGAPPPGFTLKDATAPSVNKASPPASEIQSQKLNLSGPTVFFDFAAVILFLIGCALVFVGCAGELDESMRENSSAVRQTVYAIQYGSGFIVMALSVLLGAMAKLIGKR